MPLAVGRAGITAITNPALVKMRAITAKDNMRRGKDFRFGRYRVSKGQFSLDYFLYVRNGRSCGQHTKIGSARRSMTDTAERWWERM